MKKREADVSKSRVPKIGQRNNFDLLRLLLATIVFIYHVSVLSRLPLLKLFNNIFWADFALNAFFSISGFLVFMSFENSGTVVVYFEKRLRRIYPAYFSVVFLCAVLGFFLSSSSFAGYYLTKKFFKYLFANAVFLNFLEPGLPGVFEHNHLAAINGALWTIRNEVLCYMLVPFIAYLLKRYNRIIVFITIYIFSYISYKILLSIAGNSMYNNAILSNMYYVPWHLLCFVSGAAIYCFWDIVKQRHIILAWLAVLVYFCGNVFGFSLLKPISFAVIIVYTACFLPYLGNLVKFGDLSYGIYIFHFPVVQVLISYNLFKKFPITVFLITIALVLFLSLVSWHILERPFLKRSSHYLMASDHR